MSNTEDFTARLKDVMARHRDPALHDVIWSYREGKVSQRRLLTHPAFAEAMREDSRELQRRLSAEGLTPDKMRAKLIEKLTAAGDYPPAEGEVDIVADTPKDPAR